MPTMSKSPTTTDQDWLHNSHAGDLLAREFMEPLGLATTALAANVGVETSRIADMIAGSHPIDAELDLRLSRYFGMSEGFFLGLQADFELLEAKRAHHDAIDRIVPRAA
ncbi:HigA family addiction module antitoxin [Novosphingobium sp. B-7]|uniref:HigA family addiction module antitoxin n=2 Tax=unclassified Novosphingobium TaxID=2644732 RepID=UPI0003B78586